MNEKIYIIGLLSDTHGLLRESVLDILKDSDLLIHAGDIDQPGVLDSLKTIAPVITVRGNMDTGQWAANLPRYELTECKGIFFYVIHDLFDMDLDPAASGISVVVSGHTHRPSVDWKDGLLFINPGSAGYFRHKSAATVAKIELLQGRIIPKIIDVDK